MNLQKITFSHFNEIHKSGYTLDHIYLLIQVEAEVDVKALCNESPKLEALYQGIHRKGLITREGKLTMTGKELLEFVRKEHEHVKLEKKKPIASDFELWWKAYPGTDTFSYQGKSFTGTRSLRTKKDDCKAKLNKILEEGECTLDELVQALEFEVLQKKMNSLKEKTNKLTFMQNSLTYLNQRTFEPFIELIRANVKLVPQTETGSTDI